MTDGKIENKLVEKFATETLDMAIHSKPCVIIVFGDSSYGRPAACNISVGIAVFANVPHCLLLFHDIPTGIVRILQAKGNFHGLLPLAAAGSDERIKLRVSQYTAWPELPRIAYKDLFNLELPVIRDLDPDEMAFQDGLIVNIPDMLAGKVDEATIEKIIHNSDNVRSLALAAQTKGTGKTVADWLISHQVPASSQRKKPKDVGFRAQIAVSALLEALNSESRDESVAELRRQVRKAHALNLKTHRRTIKGDPNESDNEAAKTNRRLYNAAKSSARATLPISKRRREGQAIRAPVPRAPVSEDWNVGRTTYSSDVESPTGSPITGSPVTQATPSNWIPESDPAFTFQLDSSSSPFTPCLLDGDYTLTGGVQEIWKSGGSSDASWGGGFESLKEPPSTEAPSLEPSYSSTISSYITPECNPISEENSWSGRSRDRNLLGKRRASARSRSPSLRRSSRDPILVPGFEKFNALDKASNELRGRCALCHYDGAVLTLLLRVPPSGQPTVGFPQEGDGAQTAFPFAIGSFTETRALSTFICCDACAVHLVRIGTSPLGDTIIAAVPMVSLRHNKAAVLDALDLALRGRIDSGDLLAVFMAMLDTELNDVDRKVKSGQAHPVIGVFQETAEWLLQNLNNLVEVPPFLSIEFQPHSAHPRGEKVLRELLELTEFRDPTHPSNYDLLLLRYPIPGFLVLLRQINALYHIPEHGQTLVFYKLAFLILETLCGPRASAKSQLLVGEVLRHVETARSPVSVLELEARGLLEPGTLEAFRQWPHFQEFAERCGPALTMLLRHWLRAGLGRQSALSAFNLLKRDEAIRDVFVAPLAMHFDNEMDLET
ncbi:hypothetical protein GQ53DRAFT_747403 [Thozetella sp. PMI_491]|nr:hypothetical protein GQ53DRAFT_747403 [Thozetella sp. PMI_491]